MNSIQLSAMTLISCALLFSGNSFAQAYPTKPIRIVVGFPAGSTTDQIARVVAERLRAKLGQPVIIDNKPGANGMLGVGEVAKAAPDGYTLLATNSSSITVNPQLYKKINYKTDDLAPISLVISAPFIWVTNPSGDKTANANTFASMVALAKAQDGKLSYSSGGPGNLAHLGMEMLSQRAGFKATHVPYKGGVPAQIGLLGKEVDMMLDTPLAMPHIKAGKLKPLVVTASNRLPDLPDVPTLKEVGISDLEIIFWLGVLAPAKTPPAILQTLNETIAGIRDDANAMSQLQKHGQVDLGSIPSYAQRIKNEVQQWGDVIKREGLSLE